MTAIAPAATRPAVPPLTRALRVTRLTLVNRATVYWVPAICMLGILALNVAIWAIILASVPGGSLEGTYTGASFWIFVFLFVVAVQVMTATFPLALAFSTTRRDFVTGTALSNVYLSAVYAVAYGILAALEDATNGWWVGGHVLTSPYWGDGPWERLLVVFFGFLFCAFVGNLSGAVFMRWKAIGLYLAGGALLVALGATAALIGWADAWGSVFGAMNAAGPLGVAAWLLVPAAASAVGTWAVLRGATPKAG